MIRTHDAGSLRAEHIGQQVTLAGWVARRRDHGGVAFIDLRDGSGVSQVVIREEEVARPLRSEFCLKIIGTVEKRPEGNDNPNLPSGEIEVVADTVEILSEAAPLPFPIDDHVDVGEEARIKYRYLDLRRSGPAAAIRLRSKVNAAARELLAAKDFVENETPTQTRSTPEGASDFLAYDDLDDARGLAEVDERDTAVISTTGHPSGEGDLLTDVFGAQASGVVGADHVFCSLLGVLRM